MKKNLLQLYRESNKFWRIFLLGFLIFTILVSYFAFWRGVPEAQAEWWDDGWHYRKEIKIDADYVEADLENFPVLVSITDTSLGNNAQANGDDIAFALADGTQLSHEIESYSSGTLVAWVKVPVLSSSQDTNIYMYYGNASASNQESVSDVWDSNFKAVWHMAEDPSVTTDGDCGGGSDEICDSTSNNNDVDSTGAMTSDDLISGKVGSALDFDGIDDNLTVANRNSLDSSTFTTSFWVKPNNTSDNSMILGNLKSTANWNGWGMGMDRAALTCANGDICVWISNGSSYQYVDYAYDFSTTGWTNWTVTYNSSNKEIIFYINGDLAFSTTASYVPDFAGVATEIGDVTGEGLDGKIDEIKISNSIRSADWIKTQYNNQNSPDTFLSVGTEEIGGGPVGYWAMDEGYGIVAHDESTNTNNADINGASWKTEEECVAGKCLWFDGVNDKVVASSTTITGIQTINFWVKSTSTTTSLVDVNGYANINLSSGTLVANNLSSPTIYVNAIESSSLTANEWQMVTIVIGTATNSSAFQIGKINSDYFGGFIDEVKIYNYARSESEIKEEYNAGLSGVRSSRGLSASMGGASEKRMSDDLVGYWKMDENTGTTVSDSSGRGNGGTDTANEIADWYNASWLYRKTITIDNTKVDATLSNFPVLISLSSDSDLSSKALSNGDDILFTNSAGTKLDHEIESYSSGTLVAWVEVDSLSGSADTTLYMYYGNSGASDQQNINGTWDANYAGVWHMDESSGSADDSAGINDGTFVGNLPDSQTGQIGNAQDFDGSGDYINIGNDSSLNITGDITLSAWIKTNGTVNEHVYGGYQATSPWSGSGWTMNLPTADKQGYWSDGGGAWRNSTTSVNDNIWHYIAVSISGTSLTFYFDGSSDGTAISGAPGSYTGNRVIGIHPDLSTAPFLGRIDEMRISNTARNSSWIKTSYNNQNEASSFYTFSSEQNNFSVWATGKFGSGLDFDGAEDYLDIGDINSNIKTASFWVKADLTTEDVMDFDGGTHTITMSSGVLSANGFLNPTIYVDGIATTSIDTSWHHVLVTSEVGFSVNNFDIGRVSSSYFDGKIDEVRLYNKKFTLRDTQRLYNWGPAPIMYLKMDEKTGTTVNDSSGNGNSGSLAGEALPETFGTTNIAYLADAEESSNFFNMYPASNAVDGNTSTFQFTYANANEWWRVDLGSEVGIWKIEMEKNPSFCTRPSNYKIQYSSDDITYYDLITKTSDSTCTWSWSTSTFSPFYARYIRVYDTSSEFINITEFRVYEYTVDSFVYPVWTRGKYGSAVKFAGAGDYINIANETNFDFDSDDAFSIGTWIKTDKTSEPQVIIGKMGNSSPYTGFELQVLADGSLHPYLISAWSDNVLEETSVETGLNDGQWHYVGLTYDGLMASGGLNLFIDGKIASTTVDKNTLTGSIFNNETLKVGKRTDSSNNFFDGSIDDVKIYNYAITQKQVIKDMNASHPAGGSPVGSQTAYWKFDEGRSGTAYDATVNQNNGTLYSGTSGTNTSTSSMWTLDGKFGRAIEFDGTDDYVKISDDDSLDASTALTLSAWIYLNEDVTTLADTIIFKGDRTGAIDRANYKLDIGWAENKIRFGHRDASGVDDILTSNSFLDKNTWYHLVVTFDSGQRKIYIDGLLDASDTSSDSNLITSSDPLYIGTGDDGAGPAYFFNGLIDEVKIYPYALTEEEILLDYNQGKSLIMGSVSTASDGKTVSQSANRAYCVPGDTATCNPPVLELKMDEKTGTTTYDTSGNGNNGSLAGEVLSGTFGSTNIALNKSAIQSTTSFVGVYNGCSYGGAGYTVDGLCSFNSTGTASHEWWRVDLGSEVEIWKIEMEKRPGYCTRPSNYKIQYSSDDITYYDLITKTSDLTCTWSWSTSTFSPFYARYIRVYDTSSEYLNIAEFRVYEYTAGSFVYPVWTRGKYGAGLEFDGNNYVTTSFDFSGDTEFTISGWYHRDSTSNRMDIAQSEDNNQDRIKLVRNTDGLIYGIIQSGSTASYGTFSDSSIGWIYLTMVYDGSGSSNSDKLKLYANGVSKELTFTGTIPAVVPTFTNYLNLGYDEGSGTKGTGKLDEVRIYNYARTPAQIAWEYDKGKPIAEWRFDECSGSTIHDESGNGNDGTITIGLTGTQSVIGNCNISNSASAWYNGRTGHQNGSLSFDGADDYATVGNNSIFDFGTNPFTLSLWTKVDSYTAGDWNGIFGGDSTGDSTGYRIALYDGEFDFWSQSATDIHFYSGVKPLLGNWYNVVFLRRGNVLYSYINGGLTSTQAITTAINTSGTGMTIGRLVTNLDDYYFDGQIDEVKVYNYALTAEQVKMDYNGGAVRFR